MANQALDEDDLLDQIDVDKLFPIDPPADPPSHKRVRFNLDCPPTTLPPPPKFTKQTSISTFMNKPKVNLPHIPPRQRQVTHTHRTGWWIAQDCTNLVLLHMRYKMGKIYQANYCEDPGEIEFTLENEDFDTYDILTLKFSDLNSQRSCTQEL